jgi:hypothetical protein
MVVCADCQQSVNPYRLKLEYRTKTEHGDARDTRDTNQTRRSNHVTTKTKGGAFSVTRSKRIKVKGVRRDEIDTEQLALIYWLLAKRSLREKRAREAQEKAKRRERKANER